MVTNYKQKNLFHSPDHFRFYWLHEWRDILDKADVLVRQAENHALEMGKDLQYNEKLKQAQSYAIIADALAKQMFTNDPILA
jgi:hypothetical protein